MRYNSFSTFLNFLLVSILFVGSIVVYQVGNFDGISMKTLKKDYIYKKTLKFSDLSLVEQKKYINKKLIEQKNDNFINFDEINFDENSMNSVDKLKSAIRDLKNKFLIIQNDNLILFNEKQKLAKLLKKSKDKLVEQKNRLITKSLEQINETEQQHYKNISELTTKLNDLQRENIELSQGNNEKVIKLKNQISLLNKTIKTIKNDENKNIDLKIKQEKNKNTTLNQTIGLLQKRVGLLQGNIKNIGKHQKQLLQDKDQLISTLQTKNKEILNEKKILIEKNTKTMLEIEKNNNTRAKEVNDKIAKLQNINDDIKIQKDKEIAKLNGKIENLKSDIQDLNKKSSKTLSGKSKDIENLQLSFQLSQKDKKALSAQIDDLKKKLVKTEQNKQNLSRQFSLKFEKNEEKHNENYKILNEQIFNYETTIDRLKKDKNSFTQKENEKIAQIRDAFSELRNDVKQRESKYKGNIKKLKYELKQRELFYAKKYAELKPQKPQKLVFVDKVDCQDMPFGKAKATLVCEQKVNSFLSKYSSTYYFEVVPIVDNGGFSSLKKLKNHSDMMPRSEIKRLTKLANLGLGRYRAAEGGRLIKEKFKDLAKISYAPNNVAIGKKRGFIIRVYK